MAKTSIRADILEIARVLREYSQAASDEAWRALKPGSPMGADARAYAEAARLLALPSAPASLQRAAFRPFFLVNGLSLAAQMRRFEDRALVLAALAAGLVEFADLFDALHPDRLEPDESPEEYARLSELQRRYYAYCVAQLAECGMSLEGILLTMKGDSLDQGTSYEVRAILEEGPERIASSPFYSDREKQLWTAVYAEKPGAFLELQDHLVRAYRLPFKKAPAA